MLNSKKAELEKKLVRAEKMQNQERREGEIKRIREQLADIGDLESLNWLTLQGKYNIPVKKLYIPAIIEALKKLDEDFWSDLQRKSQACDKDVQEEERKLQDKDCLSPSPLQEAKKRQDEIDENAIHYDGHELVIEALSSQVEKGVFFLSESLDLGMFEWVPPDEHVAETADYTNWLKFSNKPIIFRRRVRQKQEHNQVAVNDQEEEKKNDDWIEKKIVELGKVQKSLIDFYKICKGENVKELVRVIIQCITNYLNCAEDIKSNYQIGNISEETIQFLTSREKRSRSRHFADLLSYQQDILDKILDYDFNKLLYSDERRAFEDLMARLIRVCIMQEDLNMELGAIYACVNIRLIEKYNVYAKYQGGVTKHDCLGILLFLNTLLLKHGKKGRKYLNGCIDEPYIRWLYCQEDLVDFTTYFVNMSHPNHKGLSLMPSWYTEFRQFTYEIAPILEKMTFPQITSYLIGKNFHLKDEDTQLRFNHPNEPFQIRVKKEGVVNKKGQVQQAQFSVSLLGTPANLNANSETFKCGPLPISIKSERSAEVYVITPSTQSLTNKVESNKRWNCHDHIIEGSMHFNYVSSQKKKK